jgi:hypothetical protein
MHGHNSKNERDDRKQRAFIQHRLKHKERKIEHKNKYAIA